jgi:hypothetical protein
MPQSFPVPFRFQSVKPHVIAAFYIDEPLPPAILSGLTLRPLSSAAVIVCASDLTAREQGAMVLAVPGAHHMHRYSPSDGVCAVGVFGHGDPRWAVAAMLGAINAEAPVARCPVSLLANEQFGLEDLIDRIAWVYREWCARQIPAQMLVTRQ